MENEKIKVTITLNKETFNRIEMITEHENLKNSLKKDKERHNDYELDEFINGCVNLMLNKIETYYELAGYDDLGKPFRLKNRFKEIVKSKGIKQRDLSHATKIDEGNLSQILNNKVQPSLDYFIRIMIALNLSFDNIDKYLYREE